MPTAVKGRLWCPLLVIKNILLLWLFTKTNRDPSPGLNGIQSRAQSESSGEFSLSLENEPWSNGSSPVQQPPSRCSSSFCQPPSDTSTPQHTLKLQQQPKEKATANTSSQNANISTSQEKGARLSQDFWLTRGTKSIRRGSRAKVTRCSSDSGDAVKMHQGLNGMNSSSSSSKANAEMTRTSVISPVTVLYVQGKSSSMSGCLNCFSTPLEKEGRLKRPKSPTSLPRASSVISTAEGSSRRSSVNSVCRVNVRTDASSVQFSEESSNQEETANREQQGAQTNKNKHEPTPPVKPPRDPTVIVPPDCSKSPVQESLFESSFTFNSVFSNTIFSDAVVTTTASLDALSNNQSLLCLVENCRPESQESPPNTPQTLLNTEHESSQNAEQSAELGTDKTLTTA